MEAFDIIHIALVYDLRSVYQQMGFSAEEAAEFDSQETVDALLKGLRSLGHDVDPVGNVYDLVRRLNSGNRWDLVFNIAEGLRGLGREALVPSLLDAYEIPYTFSDPLVLTTTLHKPTAKVIASSMGIPTPMHHTFSSVDDLDGFHAAQFPLFIKPAAEGTSKGIDDSSVVYDRLDLEATVKRLLKRFQGPVMVESHLPGREFTVGILGTGEKAEAVGVLEVKCRGDSEHGVYSFERKERCEELVEYSLCEDTIAQEAKRIALQSWRGFGCRDAGRVDVKADSEGNLQFLEINPLAGLHPTHSDLPIIWGLRGKSYEDLLDSIVKSALARNPAPKDSVDCGNVGAA